MSASAYRSWNAVAIAAFLAVRVTALWKMLSNVAATLTPRHFAARSRTVGLEARDEGVVAENRRARQLQRASVRLQDRHAEPMGAVRRIAGCQCLEDPAAVQEGWESGQTSHGAVAAPRPQLRRADDPRADRIQHNVPADVHEIRIVLDDLRIEPRLKNVSDALVPPVPPLGVIAIELLQRTRQVGLGRGDGEVVVVGHLAIRMAAQGVALHHVREQRKKPAPVFVVEIDACPTRSAGRDVIRQSCGLNPEWARHGREPFMGRAIMERAHSPTS